MTKQTKVESTGMGLREKTNEGGTAPADLAMEELAGKLGIPLTLPSVPEQRIEMMAWCKDALTDTARILGAVLVLQYQRIEEPTRKKAALNSAKGELSSFECSLLPSYPLDECENFLEHKLQPEEKTYVRIAQLDQLVGTVANRARGSCRDVLRKLAQAGLIIPVTVYIGSGEHNLMGYRINPKREREVVQFVNKYGVKDAVH